MIFLSTLALAAAEEVHDAAADHASVGLFEDAALYVLIAFVIVIAVFARAGVHKMIVGGLDKRAQKIADEINEARRMREEAQELLATYQRRQREAEEEAAGIIEQAKKDAQRMAAEARAKIEEQTERRIKAAEDKIERAEAQALSEVRGQTADLAVEAARHIIRERMDAGAQGAFIDKAIAGLREKLN
ncbi:F0F1 ATP synthase subunit B [Hyphococcus luteus]|uniref:ATP synthase subunit b n=1 Tax=Hyphococcus luteus TaxID=2058213 RepID=A0A2S7K5G0_9PROT|nr:F0F1 ATP synthase subunit B [Marinicaulis flavus]PQA87743.1 ATP synthase F0 subunit B [Marinicaulis flavus]